MRTYTLVGLGTALFVLVSKYGFTDVLGPHVTLDPSRVAAQIVTGRGDLNRLSAELSELDGVISVRTGATTIEE